MQNQLKAMRAIVFVALASAIGLPHPVALSAPGAAIYTAPIDSAETLCALFDGGVGEMCASQVRVSRVTTGNEARFHVAVSRMAKPVNDYLVWHDCNTAGFRMQSRESAQAEVIKRWVRFTVNRRSARDRILQAFGRWACTEAKQGLDQASK